MNRPRYTTGVIYGGPIRAGSDVGGGHRYAEGYVYDRLNCYRPVFTLHRQSRQAAERHAQLLADCLNSGESPRSLPYVVRHGTSYGAPSRRYGARKRRP